MRFSAIPRFLRRRFGSEAQLGQLIDATRKDPSFPTTAARQTRKRAYKQSMRAKQAS